MPSTEGYPFRRLAVDHLIAGVSRIWWEINRDFLGPLPHTFQLQAGNTGNPNATDWINVGLPGVNTYFAEDDQRREGNYGKTLMTHYRVILTDGHGHRHASRPVHTFGELMEKDWLFAREIVRKERLRHNLVSVEGYLLRRMRFGEPCDSCTDPLTGEILDSKCKECNGTGFKVGYHPPTPLSVDMNPEAVIELLKGTEAPGPTTIVDNHMRILGFPAIAKHDVWVDGKSDQRWIFHEVANMAEWRHVPLVTDVTIKLLPFTDIVYTIPVGGEAAEFPGPALPMSGDGNVCIDHNYGGADNLAYVANGQGVVGATILAFTKPDYDAGVRDPAKAAARSSTGADGRWQFSMCLCCDQPYVLVFEKAGEFGPDACDIVVPCEENSSSSSSQASVAEMGGMAAAAPKKAQPGFWAGSGMDI